MEQKLTVEEIDAKIRNNDEFSQDIENVLWEVRMDAPPHAIPGHMEAVLGPQWGLILRRYELWEKELDAEEAEAWAAYREK